MAEWKQYKIYEIGDVIGGGTPDTQNPAYWNGDIPWLTPRDLSGYRKRKIDVGERSISEEGLKNSNAKLLPRGTVLLSSRAPIGYVAIAENVVCTNQGFQSIVVNEKVNNVFLYYLLSINTDYLISQGGGTTFGELSKTAIKQLSFTFPPIFDQIKIAGVLGSIDDKIDLLYRQNGTLKETCQTLFKYLLIQKGNDWQPTSFNSLIDTTFGGEWGKEQPDENFNIPISCLRGTDIADLQEGLANRVPIRFIKSKKLDSIQPKNGDLILEISGGTDDQSTGRAIYISSLNRLLFSYPVAFSNFCRLIRPRNSAFSYFIYLYLQFLYDQDEFFGLENGSSGIKNLDYKHLLFEQKYLLPSDEVIIRFNHKIDPFFEKIDKNKHQIKTLTQLRDTLLPKLISGEIRLKN